MGGPATDLAGRSEKYKVFVRIRNRFLLETYFDEISLVYVLFFFWPEVGITKLHVVDK
jgi:hypothetical protein